MRVYYAHCIAIYNTPQETRDELMLEELGLEVLNPNQAHIQVTVDDLKATGKNYMEYFKGLVSTCEVFAFRALPGGLIPSGVQKELDWARDMGKTIIELPTFIGRSMSLEDTRQYLKEVGDR